MKILFWGTPAFAVPALRALLGEGHEVVGVVTQPDRPAGRGRTLHAPPVKQVAIEEQIPVFQPEKARGDVFLSTIRELQPDLSVVVAFGQILKREVLDVPRLGSINVHASLLPALRGAAPINYAILNGDTQTGVTIMRMVEALDAGPMLHQVVEPIGDEETASELTSRLSEIGAEALIEALALIELDGAEEEAQDDSQATYAPRLTRETARIDWTESADAVARRIRAMDDVPGAWTLWRGEELKLYRPEVTADAAGEPGTVLEVIANDAARGMLVACGIGGVWVREVKPQGKRRMMTVEWLRGRGAGAGDCLG